MAYNSQEVRHVINLFAVCDSRAPSAGFKASTLNSPLVILTSNNPVKHKDVKKDAFGADQVYTMQTVSVSILEIC